MFGIEFHRSLSEPLISWIVTSGLVVHLFGFADTCSIGDEGDREWISTVAVRKCRV